MKAFLSEEELREWEILCKERGYDPSQFDVQKFVIDTLKRLNQIEKN